MTEARYIRRLLMTAGILGALVTSSPAAAAPIVGVASVIHGDTIEIHGVRIDAALEQQVLDVTQGQRVADVQHDYQPDHFRR